MLQHLLGVLSASECPRCLLLIRAVFFLLHFRVRDVRLFLTCSLRNKFSNFFLAKGHHCFTSGVRVPEPTDVTGKKCSAQLKGVPLAEARAGASWVYHWSLIETVMLEPVSQVFVYIFKRVVAKKRYALVAKKSAF